MQLLKQNQRLQKVSTSEVLPLPPQWALVLSLTLQNSNCPEFIFGTQITPESYWLRSFFFVIYGKTFLFRPDML